MRTSDRGRIITFAGTGAAERAATDDDFALEIDAFAAFSADHARTFEPRQVFGLYLDLYPLLVKEHFVGERGVRFLLASILCHFRKHLAGDLLRGFLSSYAHSAARLQINKRRRHFPPVAEFQRALPQPAIRHQRDRVRYTAVDLHIRHDALPLRDRVFYPQLLQPEHRQPHAQHLPRAEMPVHNFRQLQIFGKSLHERRLFPVYAVLAREASLRFFCDGPRVRLTGFHKSENGHDQCESRKRGVLQHFPEIDRLGCRKAAAIDIHVQCVSAQNSNEKPKHQQRKQRSPNAQAPANQKQEPEDDLRKRQRVGDELHSPRWQHLERCHLESEVREVHGYGKFQNEKRPQVSVWLECLRVACVNEDAAEDQTPDPDDGAAEVERARLHHEMIFI